tara:strand:+ start:1334 stop:2377 length:1044 start_codon:yes stop_codon:yes gene_type:complete
MKEKILKIIKTGDIESFVERYFNGDMYLFMDFISDLNLLTNETVSDFLMDDYPMTYLRRKYMLDRTLTIDEIVSTYSDILKKGDKYYLRLNDMASLKMFFKRDDGGRGYSSSEMIEKIFGEDYYEMYDDTSSDLYTDVIEELTDENLMSLSKLIVKDLSSERIDPVTELLEDIATDQGHPDYVILDNPLLLMDILKEDEESTMAILEETNELTSNLYNLHHNAYNVSYTDEKYNEATIEIKHLLEIDNIGDWISKQIKNSEGVRTIEYYHIDVTKFIPYLFSSIFNDKDQVDDYRNVFEHWGDFEDLTKEMIYEEVIDSATMNLYGNDYPDSDLVVKYINEMFDDYN